MLPPIYHAIAARIKALRCARNLSQSELSKSLDCNANDICRWETCAYRPSIQDLVDIAEFFHVPVTTFFATPSVAQELQVVITSLAPEQQTLVLLYARFLTQLEKGIL